MLMCGPKKTPSNNRALCVREIYFNLYDCSVYTGEKTSTQQMLKPE